MKSFLKTVANFSILSAVAASSLLIGAHSASAQPTGVNGSYLGGGVSVGVTNDDNGGSTLGGNVQGRYDIPTAPVSIRGAWLFNNDSSALMPMVSYDIPVSSNANAYIGAGYSFVTSDTQVSPLGDQDSVVLTTGLEAEVVRNVVVYGDAKLGLDAYRDSSDAAVSLQLGAAYRF